MSQSLSLSKRRLFAIINYICLILLIALFYFGKYHGWSLPIFAGLGILLITNLATFRILHLNTKLWKQVHAKTEQLDERQMQRTLESVKLSYIIFTILSLLVIFMISLMAGKHDSMIMLIYISLLYLAHTLPSSILAWTEKEV
ncbi:MAG: hypothetical protein GY865_09975 [candidate division Zixibacteria bacterium]|nr:hypothetical protein [candidate division Zixibacteria bacterium]